MFGLQGNCITTLALSNYFTIPRSKNLEHLLQKLFQHLTHFRSTPDMWLTSKKRHYWDSFSGKNLIF